MTPLSDQLMDRALRWVRGDMSRAEMERFADELRRNPELRESVRTMEALEQHDPFASEGHPDPAELAEYEASGNSLPGDPARTAEIREHLSLCARCREDVAAAAEARRELSPRPKVVRLVPRRGLVRMLVAAAAMLSVVAGLVTLWAHRPTPPPLSRHSMEARSFVNEILYRVRTSRQSGRTAPPIATLRIPLAADIQQMLISYGKFPELRSAILADLSKRWTERAGVTLALQSLTISDRIARATASQTFRGGSSKAGDTLVVTIDSPLQASVTIQPGRH